MKSDKGLDLCNASLWRSITTISYAGSLSSDGMYPINSLISSLSTHWMTLDVLQLKTSESI